MDGAEKLPLRGAHLGARCGRARRGIEKKADYQAVALRDQKAAELVEPERSIDTGRRGGQLNGSRSSDRCRIRSGVMIVQCCEVFLKLKG